MRSDRLTSCSASGMRALLALAALVALAITAVPAARAQDAPQPALPPQQPTVPPQPAAAPFYVPPDSPPVLTPGTLLRSEAIAGLPAGTVGWRVLYVSRAFDTDAPIAVSGAVFAPA